MAGPSKTKPEFRCSPRNLSLTPRYIAMIESAPGINFSDKLRRILDEWDRSRPRTSVPRC